MKPASHRAPQCVFYSISSAAKFLGIRRETVRLAIKRGDLQMRRLPGRKRAVITHSDLMSWQSSLAIAHYRPKEPHCDETKPSNPLLASEEVRRGIQMPSGPNASGTTKPLADPSRAVVAVLNEDRRVIDDSLQWILQKRHGRPTSKSSGWRGRSYCTSRKSLLASVEKWCKPPVDPNALRILQALPDEYPQAWRATPTRGRRARNA